MASSQGDVRSSPMAYPAVRSLPKLPLPLRPEAEYLIVGLLVRPVGHEAQSLVIALRSPATKRPSDLNRYSPDIHSARALVRSLYLCFAARARHAQTVVSTDRRHGRCGSGQQRREQRCGGGRRVRATTQARRANRAVRLERAARRQSAEAAQERQPGPKRPQAQGGQPAAPRLARCGHRPAAPRLLQPARRAARLVRPARSPRGVRACAGDCP